MTRRGFMLMELMICCSIMLIIAAPCTDIFIDYLKSQRRLQEQAEMRQIGRYLDEIVGRDVRAGSRLVYQGDSVRVEPSGVVWSATADRVQRTVDDISQVWKIAGLQARFTGTARQLTMTLAKRDERRLIFCRQETLHTCRVTAGKETGDE